MPWLYHQIHALANHHDIYVAIVESRIHYIQKKYWQIWRAEKSWPIYQPSSVRVHLIPIWYIALPQYILYRQVTYPLLLSTFNRKINQFDLDEIDIIHAHFSSPAGTIARDLSQYINKPYIVTEHASNFEHLIQTGIDVENVILNADRILCVSDMQAEEICKRINVKKSTLSIVPNGVNLSEFQLGKSFSRHREKFQLLFVGHLIASKGLNILLEALAILKAQGLKLSLQVIGDGPERIRLERQSIDLRLNSDVSFIGELPNNKLPMFYQKADILVAPSLRESFGVTLIEALACGIPVISTHSGGPESIINSQVGILVEPGNTKQLAEAITRVIFEYNKYIPKKLRHYVETNYSLELVSQRISKIYQDVINEKSTIKKVQ